MWERAGAVRTYLASIDVGADTNVTVSVQGPLTTCVCLVDSCESMHEGTACQGEAAGPRPERSGILTVLDTYL